MKFENLDKEYAIYCENFAQQATTEVRESYIEMDDIFNKYLAAVTASSWKNGFNHAIRLMKEGGLQA